MAGKLAIVTGASAGIGWEIARRLAMRDYDLLLVARREELLKALAEDISGNIGKKASFMKLDLTVESDWEKLVSKMETFQDELSLLVNNAGFGALGETLDTPSDHLIKMIELNITALTKLSYEATRIMTQKGSGGIINLASTAAFQPIPHMSVYAATKAYVLSFSEALAAEVGPKGIHVMTLCPGVTKTEFHQVAGFPENDQRLRYAMSVYECVQLGLEDFFAGKTVSITGTANKLQIFLSWLLPRSWVVKLTHKAMKGLEINRRRS